MHIEAKKYAVHLSDEPTRCTFPMNWQLGILLSAFFWTYAALQFVNGWMVDRFDVNRVIAAGFFLWSLATAATGVVRG